METVLENHSDLATESLASNIKQSLPQSTQNGIDVESSDHVYTAKPAELANPIIKIGIQQTIIPVDNGKAVNEETNTPSDQKSDVKIIEQDIEVKVELAPTKEANKEENAAKARKQIVNHVKAIMGMHYLKSDGVPAEILPGFYLGSIGAALNKKGLQDLEIGHVLCCCDGTKEAFPDLVKYKMLKLLDRPDEDITRYFEESADFIHERLSAGQKILVHCFAGKSRSTTIMISYLIKYHSMTVDEALKHIRTKRPIAGPNLGFLEQLRKYEKKLKEEAKEELIKE